MNCLTEMRPWRGRRKRKEAEEEVDFSYTWSARNLESQRFCFMINRYDLNVFFVFFKILEKI